MILIAQIEIELLDFTQAFYCQISGGHDFDGLVQDCSNSSAWAMELLQSCPKPLICL